MLTFTKEVRGNVLVLSLKGNLDAITVPELKPEIDNTTSRPRSWSTCRG